MPPMYSTYPCGINLENVMNKALPNGKIRGLDFPDQLSFALVDNHNRHYPENFLCKFLWDKDNIEDHFHPCSILPDTL